MAISMQEEERMKIRISLPALSFVEEETYFGKSNAYCGFAVV